MSKEMAVIALGVLVVITPYLGIPGTWKTILLVVVGVAIAGTGFLLRGESLARGAGRSERDHFVENSASTSSSSRDHVIGSLN